MKIDSGREPGLCIDGARSARSMDITTATLDRISVCDDLDIQKIWTLNPDPRPLKPGSLILKRICTAQV